MFLKKSDFPGTKSNLGLVLYSFVVPLYRDHQYVVCSLIFEDTDSSQCREAIRWEGEEKSGLQAVPAV